MADECAIECLAEWVGLVERSRCRALKSSCSRESHTARLSSSSRAGVSAGQETVVEMLFRVSSFVLLLHTSKAKQKTPPYHMPEISTPIMQRQTKISDHLTHLPLSFQTLLRTRKKGQLRKLIYCTRREREQNARAETCLGVSADPEIRLHFHHSINRVQRVERRVKQ